ncbi:MAG: 2-C-methyl-D-erythritol 4-phosphate cytidylyltransferase [Actinobacteria bacterium]|nr:MAG: 2-C-methyl-D-erythritol 4-phosphate cytidylyltransferase [Actinomycetota bacterium]
MNAVAIIVSGGAASRFGREGGKQTALLAGRPVMSYAVAAMAACPEVTSLVVVCHPDRVEEYAAAVADVAASAGKPLAVVAGGETRRLSVAAGLAAVRADAEAVVVHDGARPLATSDLASRTLAALAAEPACDGAVIAHPSSDTVKVVADGVVLETPDRSRLWAVQTPQAFRAPALREAHAAAARDGFEGTDDASLLERIGRVVRVVEGPRDNVKVTTAEDIAVVEAVLEARRG